MTMTLPKFEMYEEAGQIRRSSKAVTSLVVEGFGRRRYKVDFIKYMVYAQAECDETMVHFDFLYETTSLTDSSVYEEFENGYSLLSKKINNFIHWVENNLNDFPNPATSNL